MSYWAVAVPTDGGDDSSSAQTNTMKRLISRLTPRQATVSMFQVPNFRVGPIDTLVQISDNMVKLDTLIESIVHRVGRSVIDLDPSCPLLVTSAVDTQVSPIQYLENFRWNDATYTLKAGTKVQDLVDSIHKDAVARDDEMKSRVSKHNDLKSTIGGLRRKEEGTLLVRPISQYVGPSDYIEKEYVSTLFVVIQREKEAEFLQMYETLDRGAEAQAMLEEKVTDSKTESKSRRQGEQSSASTAAGNEEEKKEEAKEETVAKQRKLNCGLVVPGSARKLAGEKTEEFCLYRFFVLKQGADVVKNLCRLQRWTVRHYDEKNKEDSATIRESLVALTEKEGKFVSVLTRWCKSTYSDLFVSWIHLKAIRLFVESVLRYGVPPRFTSMLVLPAVGQDKKCRQVLHELYSSLAGADESLTAALESTEVDFSGLGGDFYPYVYLSINSGSEVKK